MNASPLADFYTVRNAAKEIGIAYMALHQRIHRGTVNVERVADRHLLISREEVERLKKEREDGLCS